jgi:outer membrane protein OmpA-like peptidoglycan-associated protein
VSIGRIITQWYGKKDPIADNTTEEGRQQNRRVESVVMGLD